MGDIKKQRKMFAKPKNIFDTERIKTENEIARKFGLKNRREIWKARSEVAKIRGRAKELISADVEEQNKFFDKLSRLGFDVKIIADVLALTEEDYLARRLQTFVHKNGLAKTPKEARQLIVHKNILVDGGIVNTPSFFVKKELENKIVLKERTKKAVEQPTEVAEAPVEEQNGKE